MRLPQPLPLRRGVTALQLISDRPPRTVQRETEGKREKEREREGGGESE